MVATFGTGVCVFAAPVPVGDPTVYSRIRFYGNPTFSSYLSPDPVAELSSTGVIKAETDRGEEIGLALAAPFGLYGGEAAFLGGARTYGGNVIYGTSVEVWYEQRYRTTTAQDSLTANMFGMELVASDGGSGGPLPNRAMFLAQMWVTTDDPEGPNAGTTDGRHLSQSDSYARLFSLVDGVYGNWRVVPPICQTFYCRTYPTFSHTVTQSDVEARIKIDDASVNLGAISLPIASEFTLTQWLFLEARGRIGESYAEARFYDPIKGGLVITGSEVAAVPEASTFWLLGIGLSVVAALTRFRRRAFPL